MNIKCHYICLRFEVICNVWTYEMGNRSLVETR